MAFDSPRLPDCKTLNTLRVNVTEHLESMGFIRRDKMQCMIKASEQEDQRNPSAQVTR